jgi:integrase
MARPRKSLWESPDGTIRIRASKGGFLLIDDNGPKPTETRRKELDQLIAIGLKRVSAGPIKEMTLFELGADYFANGMPVDENRERACGSGWFEDDKGRLRNHYRKFGGTVLSELPGDFIGQVAMAIRKHPTHHSLSLEQKTIGLGQRVLEHGRKIGKIPQAAHFSGPTQKRVDRAPTRDGQTHKVQRHDLPGHREVHRFARMFAIHHDAPWMRLFWWLSFYIGFRQGELCALETGDVRFAHGRWCIEVVKKVITDATTKETIIEPYAKGRKHRTVVVPRLLVGPLRRRVAEVEAAGGTLLFPAWGPGGADKYITYDKLKNAFVAVGELNGWEVRTYRGQEKHIKSDGQVTLPALRPSALVYTIHSARAFAATAMYQPRSGMSLRGMEMRVRKIAEQLGDTEETVRAHYLGVIDDEDSIKERAVL